MERSAYEQLIKWKNSTNRKPLILKGARQVGKTWLMKEFGKREFEEVLYVNFEDKKELKQLFEQDFNIERILTALSIETGIRAKPHKTLIIFDEIQEVERGITSLKYFCENAPEYYLMAAGSYLGISMLKNTSFPVGKVDFLNIEPLSFMEFLWALQQKSLSDLLLQGDMVLISSFKSKFIELLKQYYFTGGMPEVVKNFAENQDFEKVRTLQKNILLAFEHDFAKHIPDTLLPRVRMVWHSIPAQLSKENKKFIFSVIRKGARAKEYETAIEWLTGSGLINKVFRVTKPGMPLESYSDAKSFKIFLLDTGLLGALSGLSKTSIIKGNQIFTEFKGAMTEQYVFQQIKKSNPFYWSAENSRGEVDFILQHGERIIPVEVKAEENLKAKSLKAIQEKYKLELSLRISMSNFRKQKAMINYPLYALFDGFLEKIVVPTEQV